MGHGDNWMFSRVERLTTERSSSTTTISINHAGPVSIFHVTWVITYDTAARSSAFSKVGPGLGVVIL